MTGEQRSKLHSEECHFLAAVEEVKGSLIVGEPQRVVVACDELLTAARALGVAAFKLALPVIQ